jgi:hypothetical protein
MVQAVSFEMYIYEITAPHILGDSSLRFISSCAFKEHLTYSSNPRHPELSGIKIGNVLLRRYN